MYVTLFYELIFLGDWKILKGTEMKRRNYGLTSIDENLFIIGGTDENDQVTRKNESFNVNTKQWELKSPLITHRE